MAMFLRNSLSTFRGGSGASEVFLVGGPMDDLLGHSITWRLAVGARVRGYDIRSRGEI